MVKNTLFKRAVEGVVPNEGLHPYLDGPTGIAFAKADSVAAAKALVDYMKDHKTMSLKGRLLGRQVFDAEQVTAISKLPSREVLIRSFLARSTHRYPTL